MLVLNLSASQYLANDHCNPIAFDDDLALGDGLIVGEHDHRIVLVGIELDHGATAHAKKLVDRDHRMAKDHGDFDFDTVQR